jgi:hypothetical protein
MEDLFTTSIMINDQPVRFRVVFDEEKYEFISEEATGSPAFSFRREHDEWVDEQAVSPEIKNQAIEALEKYLMKQH